MVASMAWALRLYVPAGFIMFAEMSRADRAETAHPQASKRSEDGSHSFAMREERVAGVRTLESSKWWVERRSGSERVVGR
jgi:hypothetical protein